MSLSLAVNGKAKALPRLSGGFVKGSVPLHTALIREADERHMKHEIDAWRRRNFAKFSQDLEKIRLAEKHEIPTMFGTLRLRRINSTLDQQNWMLEQGLFNPDNHGDMLQYCHEAGIEIDNFGLASCRVVTTAGCNFIVDAFQGTVEPEILKYHGTGDGSTAESSADTALVSEFTTELTTDNTRATGSLGEGASANIFSTVGTNPYDATVGVEEHGIFSVAAVASGVLLDRTVFTVVNITSGNSLESTYQLTMVAGA